MNNPVLPSGEAPAGVFQIARLAREQALGQKAYLEFLRVPALSLGLYVLPAGGVDQQQPHSEDEVYYVVGGRAQMVVGADSFAVETGSVIYVGAGVEHRFFDIVEEVSVLVFFAPAEYTLR